MRATLKDVAKRANRSVSTVSRVLNNKSRKFRISKDTEALVLKAAQELNYRPNQLARGLRLKKTQTIGLVIPDISNPFFACLTRSIQKTAHRSGYRVVVCDTDENQELEVEHIDLLLSTGVDGLIVMPVGQEFKHLESVRRKGACLVLVDRCFDEFDASSVIVDNYKGAYEAVEHLINAGHTRIAIIQGLPHTYTSNKRLEGYKDALTNHGIPIDNRLIVGKDFRKQNGYVETKFLLSMEARPTAIFATSDLITLGALEGIFEEGLSIPDDVSLVAFDDIEFAPFLVAPLTIVSQPREMMGEIAVKLLVEEIENARNLQAGKAKRIVLTPKLVVRDSVRVLSAASANEVSAA